MARIRQIRQLRFTLLVCVVTALMTAGCQRQKQSETGKTYTPDAPAKQGGASGGSGGKGDAQPLNAPADTTNGKSSQASDIGSSSATHGQVVAEPGAPVEHDAQKPPSQPKGPGGHS